LVYSKLATYAQLSEDEDLSPKTCQKCGILEITGSQNCKFHASFLRVAIPKECMPLVCGKNPGILQRIESVCGIRPIVNDSEFWLQGKTSDVKKAFRMIRHRFGKGNREQAVGTWNCCGRDAGQGRAGQGKECTEGMSHVFSRKVFALDCEMVRTYAGQEIARVTLNFSGKICLDEFVKPKNKIRDYRSKYSGITVDTLRGVETRLSDVRRSLNRLVSDSDILVGHSIDHDLKCLHWEHEKVVDTSIAFPNPNGSKKKMSLKALVKEHLGRQIQQGTEGHDSREDALAALDLMKLKVS